MRTFIRPLATLAAFAAFAIPSSATAAVPGVDADLSWGISSTEMQKSAAALQDLGSQWTRIDIQWKQVETANNSYAQWALDQADAAIDKARSVGQHVLVMVYNAPAWASGSSSSNVPQNPQDFADFMSYIANRYRGKVEAYEVWNEPNIQRFWSTGPSAAQYTQLLKASYPAIKAVDPAAKVLFAGLSLSDYQYVEAAYAAGVKGYFDVMATHPYTFCEAKGPADVHYGSDGRLTKDSFLAYREIRKSMAAQGDAKPIWFTEWGWTTYSGDCGVTETEQADYTYLALKLMEEDPYVEVSFLYNLRNNYWQKDADEFEARFGLMRSDYSHKPAYEAFKAYTHGQPWNVTSPTPSSGGTSGGSTTNTAPVPTSTTVKVKRGRAKRSAPTSARTAPLAATVRGTVSPANAGEARVFVQRRVGGGWKTLVTSTTLVKSDGTFAHRVRNMPTGSLRIYARYSGSETAQPSRSPYVTLRSS